MNKFSTALIVLILVGCSQGDQRSAVKGGAVKDGAAVQRTTGTPSAMSRAGSVKRPGSFSSLPDRGELLAYRTAPKQQGAYTWHRAAVSEEHALRAIVERKLRVVTPSGEILDIEYDHHIEHPSGDWTWVGHLPGDRNAQTILTFGTQAVFGSIAQTGKRSLRLTSRGGSAWVVETDPRKLVGIASAGANPRKSDHLSVPKQRNALADAISVLRPHATQPSSATAAAVATIDVAVGYTGGLASRLGGTSAALTRINYLVSVTNEAYSLSQVNARIRLVHSMQVSYTDNTTNESTLEQLTGYDVSEQRDITPNVAFNGLRAAREQHGADLVVLLRQFRDPEQDGCGIAWLIGGGRTGVAPGDGQDYFGYSVVSDGTDRNEQDGNDYFCRDESFAHEISHNVGSAHDRDAAEGEDGVLNDPDDYGAFSYSFGYKTGTSAGNFYTIMAYGDAGQQDYRVFSNPRIATCGGRACGTTSDDNARSLSALAPLIAAFRAGSLLPTGSTAAHDFNGDGESDILWHRYTGENSVWLSANWLNRQAVPSVASAWRVVGTGDFDEDGRSDVFWRNAVTGQNSIWKAASTSTQQAVATVATTWIVAGIGDFNGDGRADVFWRQNNTGRNVIWLTANVATPQLVSSTGSAGWIVAGVGDFDRDGRADVLWRNANGKNVIWRSANSATPIAVSATASDWKVAGVGDFDSDGRSDVFWRNSTTGKNVVWFRARSTTALSIASTGLSWSVASIGDFDGDSYADVLWREASSGRNVIWRNADVTRGRALLSLGGEWQVASR